MSRYVIPLMVAMTGLSGPAFAGPDAQHPFGLGVQIGQPTGITAKFYLGGERNALDFALATGYPGGLYFHGTYLWHPSVLTEGNNVSVPWHVGVGGFIWNRDTWMWGRYDNDNDPWWDDDRDNHTGVGVRVPIGIDVNLDEPRLQFFGDIALAVLVFPAVRPGFDAAIGARYYF